MVVQKYGYLVADSGFLRLPHYVGGHLAENPRAVVVELKVDDGQLGRRVLSGERPREVVAGESGVFVYEPLYLGEYDCRGFADAGAGVRHGLRPAGFRIRRQADGERVGVRNAVYVRAADCETLMLRAFYSHVERAVRNQVASGQRVLEGREAGVEAVGYRLHIRRARFAEFDYEHRGARVVR